MMAPIVALLMLLVSPVVEGAVGGSVAGFSRRSCGTDRVEYLKTKDGYFVVVNGKKIDDPGLICEALAVYFANKCLDPDSLVDEWGDIARKFCVEDCKFAAGSDHDVTFGRKLLKQPPEVSAYLNRFSKMESPQEGVKFLILTSPHKEKALAMPGVVLLCCIVICPCFRARKKEPIEEKALAKEPTSSDSVSPLYGSASPNKNPATPRKVPSSPSLFSMSPHQNKIGSLQLTISQIIKATQNFSRSMKLGEGGFGTIYKGILPDGQVVAIKRANKEHLANLRDEFSSEVELLTKIEHRSLVRLLGYTEKGNERIIITEYVPNGTLREHLDGLHGHILDFNQRLEIAIDVAHALTYLHLYAEKPIIHRDVKASNILLTESFRAKVSDFGFARIGPTEAGQTHISTRVKGTAGYLDPEYLRTSQLTPKSDVFSFGILLIELLSARRPVEMKRSIQERITIRWAFKKFNEGNLWGLLDPKLEEDVNPEIVTKMLSLAFHCAAPTRVNRPLMKEVGEQLWEIRKDFGKSPRT
ncbi:Calmodulin-binding receptor-like cytoplasmic kinase 3 [Apostasia shenzhenica]|uniref:non-specific serine/threonine protein kinase n=1 Tax=Apostasia shenzhenica TaxID=1088818 RepID=A0A2I0ABF7_9ASPA|nr:Calmodulin-binding receptor-like cytoplasmic kinase 3 [Apostasia shenzhenica]